MAHDDWSDGLIGYVQRTVKLDCAGLERHTTAAWRNELGVAVLWGMTDISVKERLTLGAERDQFEVSARMMSSAAFVFHRVRGKGSAQVDTGQKFE